MENPEEILHSLEEFSKMKPKDIPRELEDYLCFVAKTGDTVYQWSSIKSLFREKLINVINEFYESCPSIDIPPCPNVDLFNYDLMKNFILEKLDTFAAAPFTVQRICELLTTPRKEYNRIDKYMRALEKNILVVSTMEPGGRRSTENGEGIVNGIESEHHVPEPSSEINVEEMDDSPSWPRNDISFENNKNDSLIPEKIQTNSTPGAFDAIKITPVTGSNGQESVISCTIVDEQRYDLEIWKFSPKNNEELDLKPEAECIRETEIEIKTVEISEEIEEINATDTKSSHPEVPAVLPTEEKVPVECEIENISPETSTFFPENLQAESNSQDEKTTKDETSTDLKDEKKEDTTKVQVEEISTQSLESKEIVEEAVKSEGSGDNIVDKECLETIKPAQESVEVQSLAETLPTEETAAINEETEKAELTEAKVVESSETDIVKEKSDTLPLDTNPSEILVENKQLEAESKAENNEKIEEKIEEVELEAESKTSDETKSDKEEPVPMDVDVVSDKTDVTVGEEQTSSDSTSPA